MRWADRHGVSYLAWAWDAHGGWTCRGGPTLIKDYDGTPTGFGVGFRDHLRALSASAAARAPRGEAGASPISSSQAALSPSPPTAG